MRKNITALIIFGLLSVYLHNQNIMAEEYLKFAWLRDKSVVKTEVATTTTAVKITSINAEKTTQTWDVVREGNLREYLETFQEEFESLIESSSDEIVTNNNEHAIKRSAIKWKTKMIDKLKDRFEDENTLVVLLDSWLLSVKMLNFFEIGNGVDIFIDDQPLAIDSSKQIVNMIEDVAGIFILPDKYTLVQKYISDYALKRPFSGEFNDLKNSSLRLDSKAIKKLSKILGLPLLPVKATKKGNKRNNSFRRSASRFVDILEDVPQELRWEIELFLLSIDKNQSVNSVLSSLERLTISSEELTNIAGNLPDDLRLNVELLMKSVDENRSTKSILESLNTISEQTKVISESVSSLTTTIDNSFNESRRLVDHITWRVGQILILLFILGVLITIIIMVCRKKG